MSELDRSPWPVSTSSFTTDSLRSKWNQTCWAVLRNQYFQILESVFLRKQHTILQGGFRSGTQAQCRRNQDWLNMWKASFYALLEPGYGSSCSSSLSLSTVSFHCPSLLPIWFRVCLHFFPSQPLALIDLALLVPSCWPLAHASPVILPSQPTLF